MGRARNTTPAAAAERRTDPFSPVLGTSRGNGAAGQEEAPPQPAEPPALEVSLTADAVKATMDMLSSYTSFEGDSPYDHIDDRSLAEAASYALDLAVDGGAFDSSRPVPRLYPVTGGEVLLVVDLPGGTRRVAATVGDSATQLVDHQATGTAFVNQLLTSVVESANGLLADWPQL